MGREKDDDLAKLMKACRNLLNHHDATIDYPAPTKRKRISFRNSWDKLESVWFEIDGKSQESRT